MLTGRIGRDHGFAAAFDKPFAQFLSVVRAVGYQPLRDRYPGAAGRRHQPNHGCCRRSRQRLSGRPVASVSAWTLLRTPAPRAADRVAEGPPFAPPAERWALTWVVSIAAEETTPLESGQLVEVRFPDTLFAPTVEAIVDRRVWPIFWRTVAPACAGPQHVQNPTDHAAIIDPMGAATTARQQRFNASPLLIAKPIKLLSHQGPPLSGSL